MMQHELSNIQCSSQIGYKVKERNNVSIWGRRKIHKKRPGHTQ